MIDTLTDDWYADTIFLNDRTMETVLIFLPKSLATKDENGYLLGRFSPKNASSSDCFYVLAVDENWPNGEVIGSFRISSTKRREKNFKENHLIVSCINGQLIVNKVVKEGKICPLSQCHVVQYDETSLIKSELFIPKDSLLSDDYLREECDYFKLLAHQLKRKETTSQSKTDQDLPKFLHHVFAVFHWLSYALDVSRLATYSSIGSHLREHITNLQWLIEKTWRDGSVNLQTGNLLFSLIFDLLGGLAVAYALEEMTMGGRIHFFNLMASKTEDLLELIKCMIKWLMGSPAGLKLNYPLNYILGNFFLYNIYLWWTFLGLIRPLLEIGFKAFLKLGVLGIALQIAILADIFSLVTFHLYCIYIYAARLYEFQLKGLCSLSKIFLGRNRNPEPDKVDSCPYSTEQLFVGTVCFTVLLFLLPTSLVYYVVFTLIRLGFIFLGGALTHARYLLRILPIYSSIVWIAHPQLTMTTTKLMPVCGMTDAGVVTLIVQPEVSSWWQTMRMCVPQILKKPQSVDWQGTIKHVLMGKLMYPV